MGGGLAAEVSPNESVVGLFMDFKVSMRCPMGSIGRSLTYVKINFYVCSNSHYISNNMNDFRFHLKIQKNDI